MSEENGNGKRGTFNLQTVAVIVNFVLIAVGGLAAYSTLRVASEINRESQAQFRILVTTQLADIHEQMRTHGQEIREIQVALARLQSQKGQ